jgi:hypothetical protein
MTAPVAGGIILPTASAFIPGSCVGEHSWSTSTVGSDQSTLAGVLAGFVFGGIIVLLSVKSASRSEHSIKALKLLICAFFGLAVVADLLACEAADGNCLRTQSGETISEGMLGTFAIIMITALTWLVVAYDVHGQGVLRFLRHIGYFAYAFVAFQLCTSSSGYLGAEVPGGAPTAASVPLYAVGALLCLTAFPAGSRIVKLSAAWMESKWRQNTNRPRPAAESRHQIKRRQVDRCAWASLSYLAITALINLLTSADGNWSKPQVPVAYAVAFSSLLIPLILMILAMQAMAVDQDEPSVPGRQPAGIPDNQAKVAASRLGT